MSLLLEALRLCQQLAPPLREQVDHQIHANAHDAQEYEHEGYSMVCHSDFDQQVAARERYYRNKYGDQY